MRKFRKHQKPAFRYALRETHPFLGMQMRLGKSKLVISAALLSKPRDRRRGLRVLVLAPNSALDSWQDELDAEGETDVCRPTGTRARRRAAMRAGARWTLLNKEAWRTLPEIARRPRCVACKGLGRRRATLGMAVVKQARSSNDTVYVGRPSKWGNPFVVGRDGDRADCVALYRAYLLTQPELLDDLQELANLKLGCHCAPQLCHGDVLMELVRQRVKPRWCGACKGKGYGPVQGPTRWDHVVVDESFIRNPQSQVTQFMLSSFRDVPHRWLLTGMANPESRLDYWSQFAWLDGAAFGHRNYWSFRAAYFHPDPRGHGWRVNRDARQAIDKWVGTRGFIQTRASVGLKDRKVYRRRVLEFPKAVRRRYYEMESEFCRQRRSGEREETVYAPVKWTWLRQLCGGFVDGKLVWREPYRELARLATGEFGNEQLVVWFVFTPEIEAAFEALKKAKVSCARYYGKVKPQRRRAVRSLFDAGSLRVLLAQAEMGKTSLQLGAANSTIYFSNPASYDTRAQTEDRTLLTDKDEPLLYLDFLVRDTVSEDVRDVLREKRWRSEGSIRRAVRARMEARHG
jgi:hypothetical protein